jgi:hypothetical protein
VPTFNFWRNRVFTKHVPLLGALGPDLTQVNDLFPFLKIKLYMNNETEARCAPQILQIFDRHDNVVTDVLGGCSPAS